MTIPSVVATPFPPLKSQNMGSKCPIMAKKPNKIFSVTQVCQSTKPKVYKTVAKLAAANPFKASTNKTIEPAFLPSTRKVFVAPAFPLPC